MSSLQCAMTVSTRVIKLVLSSHNADYVPLSNGLRLQVLPNLSFLPRCQKHHFGAFIQDQQILVVWDDQPRQLLDRAAQIEASLMEMIWENDKSYEGMDEKKGPTNVTTAEINDGSSDDEEAFAVEERPTMLLNPMMIGLTITLLIAALGLGWRNLAQEIAVDGNYTRLALLIVTPCQMFVSLVSNWKS